ncbi:MAG: peptidyl-prolyl cis-trans isomerase, partial [Emcibacteraceae bacterium]|nr:peptidyl-prolyl cis-trans isomerase [Emcibacteraceae bacterium]
TLTKYTTEERVAEVLVIPATKMTAIGEATDEALNAFYDDNNPLYMAQEYRDVSYFEISANQIAETIEVSEDVTHEMYESRIANYTKEEERGFVQMLLDDMDAADAAVAELVAGKSFEDVLSDRTGDTAEDSTFEAQPRSEFVGLYGEDAAVELYALSEGNYTKPIETGFGVYIFKLADVTPGEIQSYDDVKDSLSSSLKLEQAVDQLFDVRNTIDDELAAGAPLSEIASVIGASVVKVENVSIEGIMPDGNASANLPLIIDFLDVAFRGNIGDELILNEGLANKFYMVEVDNIYDATLKPFDDVKEQVSADWSRNRRVELATELSDKIIADFETNASTDLATYQDIESGDYTVNTVTVDRANAENAVATDIHGSIFSQGVGDIQKIAAADGDGFVIVRVVERILSDDVDEEAKKGTNDQIQTALQNDIMGAFTMHLYDALPVVIDENNVQAVLDQLVTPTDQ